MTMSLEWALAPKIWIAGDAMPVKVTLRNRLGGAVPAPDPETGMPLAFTILDADGREVANFSAAIRDMAVLGTVGEQSRPQVTLADQGGATYRGDLSQLMVAALAPGEYRLVAHHSLEGVRFASEPHAFRAVAPGIAALTRAQAPEGKRMVSVAARTDLDGALTLARSDAPGVRPDLLNFRGVGAMTAASGALSLTAATTIGENFYGLWTVAIDGAQVRAIMAPEGNGSSPPPRAIEVELDSPRALGAWQTDDGGLVIALASGDPAQGYALVRLDRGGEAATIRAPAARGMTHAAVTVRIDDEDSALTLIEADAEGRVFARSWSLGALAPLGAPVTLSGPGRPVLSMGAPRAATDALAYVDMVLAPPADGAATLTRVPLDGGAAEAWDLPRTRAPIETFLWPDMPTTAPAPVGIALGRAAALRFGAAGATWAPALADIAGLADLALFALPGDRMWLGWRSETKGVEFHDISAN